MTVLTLRALEKHYGSIKAVDHVDLQLESGEFMAILGPSGSGKSTLMRMVAGLESPTAGDILVDGQSVVNVPPQHRNVAMVFQSFALYPHMTVRDNILFPLVSRKVPKHEHEARLNKATSMLGVEDLLDRRPNRLSGGQQQRVALARALVRDPDLFVFDEPLSALDAQIRSRARAELRELHDQTRITTLYVTHDQVEAMGLADRVAVINEGRLHQVGTPQELYNDPADLFVAGFIGNPPMNLIPINETTVAGIRPEDMLVDPEGDVSNVFIDLAVTIEHIEYLGSEWLAHGQAQSDADTHGQELHVIARLPASSHPDFVSGQKCRMVGQRKDVCLFDRASGKRQARAEVPA
ncbi:MAG TPA: ABC transporter ATP-binding protein [Marinobacter sp.]|uniref:ABC transporter ATP-binding protein n=2 Tax=root TaxID=1 RepID=A0A831R838_9GAMM|nr:ABC transporter ATP-binding protein [Marinobacter antarcticus]HDZ38642.1 ABC transporter ATP-binding protein [Marinobacter sp.]HEA54130.1 ABC transporter ATP-binding protein [Marinobacter antarcticus]